MRLAVILSSSTEILSMVASCWRFISSSSLTTVGNRGLQIACDRKSAISSSLCSARDNKSSQQAASACFLIAVDRPLILVQFLLCTARVAAVQPVAKFMLIPFNFLTGLPITLLSIEGISSFACLGQLFDLTSLKFTRPIGIFRCYLSQECDTQKKAKKIVKEFYSQSLLVIEL